MNGGAAAQRDRLPVEGHGALEARYSRSTSALPWSTGATEKPQFPVTSSVTLRRIFDSAPGFTGSVKSECV
jgi:hypothetical protein